MKQRTLYLTSMVCLLPMVLGMLLYHDLPDMVPNHFDFSGNPDGYINKAVMIFGVPIGAVVVNLFCHWFVVQNKMLHQTVPIQMEWVMLWLCPVLTVMIVPMSLLTGIGMEVPVAFYIHLFISVLLIVVGNYLPKCKPNYMCGIRVPWTRASEENWRKTHHFSGFVWVGCGVLSLLGLFLDLPWVLYLELPIVILLPCGYSYWCYRKELHRRGE